MSNKQPGSEAERIRAAEAALGEVRPGMKLGLGTGRTAEAFVRVLGDRVRAGLDVVGVPTSERTARLAEAEQIPLTTLDLEPVLDLTIDGADEIDPSLHAIKGGGGALLREKVIAAASARVIAVVDSSKFVMRLGRFPVPVEVFPFATDFVGARLADLGAPVSLRMLGDQPFLTDQANHILDVAFGSITDIRQTALAIAAIPGVAEHGLFTSEIDTVIIARADTVEFRHTDRS
jgi:ribose 5-phosphate isomerase A